MAFEFLNETEQRQMVKSALYNVEQQIMQKQLELTLNTPRQGFDAASIQQQITDLQAGYDAIKGKYANLLAG